MSRSRTFRPRLELLEDRLVPAALTLHVTTTLDRIAADGKLSLREAISRANDNPGPDTIVVPAGLYSITIPPGPGPLNDSGAFDLLDSVTLTGAGAASTVVTARQLDRVFAVSGSGSPIKITLRGLTIRGGNGGDGGGILMGDADLTLRGCVVTANTATGNGAGISDALDPGSGDLTLIRSTVSHNSAGGDGGGIFLEANSAVTLHHSSVRRNTAGGNGGGIRAGTATLTNSTVSGNSAEDFGGGILAGTATLTRSTVSGNSASRGGGIDASMATLTNSTVSGNSAEDFGGGGIRATTATLTNSTVSRNSASRGGGIDAGTATLTNSTVSGNAAADEGGGIRATTATLSNSTVSRNAAGGTGGGIGAGTATLSNSTVSGNTAGGEGGGIRATTATLTNSTVSGNTAGTFGGGIRAGAATLLHVTITRNRAQTGGGLSRNGASGSFNVTHTIIARNRVIPTGEAPDLSGVFTSQGHNLIGVNAGAETSFPAGTSSVNGDRVGTAAAPINPRLGRLARNGGRTQTHALLPGSPALNRGDNVAAADAGLTTDQRGGTFQRRVGPFVDIGAFERQ